MFTRCPECETTFRLGAQDLRRASGKVRCGECATVFNALDYLEEEADRLGPAANAWQSEPANDERDEPEDSNLLTGSDEVTADTHDIDDIDDIADRDDEPAAGSPDYLTNDNGAELIPDALTEVAGEFDDYADDDPDDDAEANILVAEPDDARAAGDSTGQPGNFGTEFSLDSAAEDEALTDDGDDIVSFVNLGDDSNDYPEVSDAVTAAIGASQAADSGQPDTEDLSLAADEAAWNAGRSNPFDDAPDINQADDTIEFIISDDDEETEAEFIFASGSDDSSGDVAAEGNADPEHPEAANDDAGDDGYDFDDTIWERIPGVGSGDAAAQDGLRAESGAGQTEWSGDDDGVEARHEPAMPGESSDTEDTDAIRSENDSDSDRESEQESDAGAGMDTLEFDAPANTWSNIFSRTSPTVLLPDAAEHDQPDAGTQADHGTAEAEELSAWSKELIASNPDIQPRQPETDDDIDAGMEADEWVPELDQNDARADPTTDQDENQAEWITEAGADDADESSLAADTDEDDWEDWIIELDERSAPGGDAAEHAETAPEILQASAEPAADTAASGDADDDSATESSQESERQSDEADDSESLTAAFATGEYDEDKYNVQHIVLSDEAKPDAAGLTQAFAAAAAEEIPPWQPDADEKSSAQKPRTLLWLAGTALIVITLAVQLIHYNRDALARNIAWGDSVRRIYNGLGMELFPNWSLDDYEIRGSEAIAGESGPDIMDIRAQIAAIGNEPTGLPHIRVVLRDRWSNPVAAKTLGPAEYTTPDILPDDAMLQPNQTLAAHVSIVDPGSGAQGFELELCLPRRHTGLECTGRPFE